MSSLFSFISIGSCNDSSSAWVEFFRNSPAWIALIISSVLPFITKKLEIEKMHKQFIFEEKYKIYTAHFSKLYEFNNSIKSFLIVLNKALNGKAFGNDITEAKQELHVSWDGIKNYESNLWIVAPNNILELRKQLLILVKELNVSINNIENEKGFEFSSEDLNKLIAIADKIQNPLSQYLQYYKDEIEKVFN